MRQPTPPPRPQHSKIPAFSLNRSQAQAQQPTDTVGSGDSRLGLSTFFTKVGPTQVIYNGDRMWARITLTLLTAGPVSVGQLNDLLPVTSGKGQVLQTNVPTTFEVAKSNQLFVACTSLNAINVSIQPYPWLETITGILTTM